MTSGDRPSLRERAAAILDRAGALHTAMWLRRHAPLPTISIVTFHRIADLTPDDPYDPDTVDATPAQFRRHVETLARFGTPIGMDALIAGLDGAELPPNPVMITFDDGYRSCVDVALPILDELGVPATFFIATAFVAEPALYWWEQIAVALHRARCTIADLTYPSPLRIDARDPRSRRLLDDIVKNTRDLDLARFLRELRAALDVVWSPEIEASLATPLIMRWNDVRRLANAGMSIESHTRSHRVLDTLGPAELRAELIGSRRDLESELGRPVRAIAYPVGRPLQPSVRRAVDAGYLVGLTNHGGVNRLRHTATRFDRLDVRRVATERSQSDALFLAEIAVPWLTALHLPVGAPRHVPARSRTSAIAHAMHAPGGRFCRARRTSGPARGPRGPSH